jgi:aryl-alcohol dehydrogenase-like predicted oxidoreductase
MELRGAPRGPEISGERAGQVLNAVLDGGITLIDTSKVPALVPGSRLA